MAERVDLDAVMDLGMQPFTGWTVAQWRTWQDMVPAMVAELRDAREVVEAGRDLAALVPGDREFPDALTRLLICLSAYDRHVSPSTPDPAGPP